MTQELTDGTSAPVTVTLESAGPISAYTVNAAGARGKSRRHAVQVADRWHVRHNVGEAVDKTVTAHDACVRAAMTGSRAGHPPGSVMPTRST